MVAILAECPGCLTTSQLCSHTRGLSYDRISLLTQSSHVTRTNCVRQRALDYIGSNNMKSLFFLTVPASRHMCVITEKYLRRDHIRLASWYRRENQAKVDGDSSSSFTMHEPRQYNTKISCTGHGYLRVYQTVCMSMNTFIYVHVCIHHITISPHHDSFRVISSALTF